MKKNNLTNSEAVGIGCIVSIVVSASCLILMYASPSFLAAPVLVVSVVPSILTGALVGRYFAGTRLGAWFGAVCGAIAGLGLFFWAFSKMMLD